MYNKYDPSILNNNNRTKHTEKQDKNDTQVG